MNKKKRNYKILSILVFALFFSTSALAANTDLDFSENTTISNITLGSGTTDMTIFGWSNAESVSVENGIFTVTNPGPFKVGSSNVGVGTIVILTGGATSSCVSNAVPGTSSTTLPTASGTYIIRPLAATSCSSLCSSLTGAATYNAYPTCGAATCSSGYTLSGSGSSATCVVQSSGGGGGGGGGIVTTPSQKPATTTSAVAVPVCTSWNYSDWGTCIDGKRRRIVGLGSPVGCAGGTPEIEESCSMPASVEAKKLVNIVEVKKDDDGDGISNDLEIALGLDHRLADSDGDGYSDKMELVNGHSPKGPGRFVPDTAFTERNKGRIFIQVEGKGEAWYVNPGDGSRYYLGRPRDAFEIMRKQSLGVNHKFVTDRQGKLYEGKYRGRIFLDVEDKGKAYYIDIKDARAYYLGSPENAFEVIRSRGLGIRNYDINKIRVGLMD